MFLAGAGMADQQSPLSTLGVLCTLEEGKPTEFPPQEAQEADAPLLSLQKAIAEFLGTYMLVFIGCGSLFVDQRSQITPVGVALAWGLAVTTVIYTVGHISGAHLNPAVTVGLAAAQRFPWKDVPAYVGVQIMGATLASATLRVLFRDDHAKVMVTLPAGSTSNVEAIVWECIITFILTLVICSAATDQRAPKELAGVAVGAAIFCNALIAGKISGASMNPARSIGSAIAAHTFEKLWIYIVAPVSGAVIASMTHKILSLPRKL